MNNYLLTCRSLTYAQRTRQALERAGFHAFILRTPQKLSREGCGYSVKLKKARLSAAIALLDEAELTPKRVFIIKNDGTFEETAI